MIFQPRSTAPLEEVDSPEPRTAEEHATLIQMKAATVARNHGKGVPFTVTHDTEGISRAAVLEEIDTFLRHYEDHGAIVMYRLDSRPVKDNEYAFITN